MGGIVFGNGVNEVDLNEIAAGSTYVVCLLYCFGHQFVNIYLRSAVGYRFRNTYGE